MTPSPSRRKLLAGAAGLVALANTPGHAQPLASHGPRITGRSHPELAGLDEFMARFVREQQVTGAALAITQGGRLVYARGFGVADRQQGRAVQPTDLFRIASISKSITAVAVLQLAERARLDLDGGVWEMLALPEPADPRWKRVTVRHLLHHAGGWDDEVFDVMFRSAQVAKALGASLPVDHRQIVRYMLGQPLQFEPGDHFAYSNFGYCLLGRVVERLSGTAYGQYVQREVLAPLGIRRMRLGRSPASERAEDEVSYHDQQYRTAPAVVGPIGERVPLPYGAWSLEAMDSNGGWLASAIDLARFACAFDNPAACPILQAKTIATMFARPQGKAGIEEQGNYPGCGWFVWPGGHHAHKAATSSNGMLVGTSTYLMRRHDGINWAVLFNSGVSPDGKPLMIRFRDASSAVFDRITGWPGQDQFPAWP
jgi:N-acyl-D-amino-acid deacylase